MKTLLRPITLGALEQAQEDLRKLLSVRQEAVAVTLGRLN
jgi:hypothetical protein